MTKNEIKSFFNIDVDSLEFIKTNMHKEGVYTALVEQNGLSTLILKTEEEYKIVWISNGEKLITVQEI